MDFNKVLTLQNKYGFQRAKNFNEMKNVYKNMLHDPMVTKKDVQTELDKWHGETSNPYVNTGKPEEISSRNQLIRIVKNELKSRR